MSNVEPTTDDEGRGYRPQPSPAAQRNLEKWLDAARVAYGDHGCPLWCQHPDKCKDDLWERGQSALHHTGPITTLDTSRRRSDLFVQLQLVGYEEGGGPLTADVRVTVHDTVQVADPIATVLHADDAVELATELLTFARFARTVKR